MSAAIGDVVLTQHLNRDTGAYSLTIEQAPPRVLISELTLTALTTPDVNYWPALQQNCVLEPGNGPGLYGGCILRIFAADRTVIYRITCKHNDWTWIGEWPD